MKSSVFSRKPAQAFVQFATALAVGLSLQVATPAQAQTIDCTVAASRTACPRRLDAESSRGMALGLGMRAGAVSTSALAYNPAGLTAAALYHMEGTVDYMTDSGTVALGSAVADSATSKIAGGVSVRGFLSNDEGGLDGIDGRVALAMPFSESFAVGLSGRYIAVGTEVPKDEGEGFRDQKLAKGITLDASIQIKAGEMVYLAVGAYNFINMNSPLVPVMAGASIGIAPMQGMAIGLDTLIDFSTFGKPFPNFGAGIEFLAAEAFPLRGGYRYDRARESHQLTAGVGYTDATIGVDLSLRQDLNGEKQDTRILGALRIYVH